MPQGCLPLMSAETALDRRLHRWKPAEPVSVNTKSTCDTDHKTTLHDLNTWYIANCRCHQARTTQRRRADELRRRRTRWVGPVTFDAAGDD
jgi:hypothetical protein